MGTITNHKTHTKMKLAAISTISFGFLAHGSPTNPKPSLPLVKRVMAASLAITEKSQELVQDIFNNGKLDSEQKAGLNNFRTQADMQIERMLRANLNLHFPGIKSVGEEGENAEIPESQFIDLDAASEKYQKLADYPVELDEIVDASELTIWVDPVDGTKELIDGFVFHVTTLVGISYQGRPIAGVINQPFVERTIWAIVGVGAFGFEEVENELPGLVLTTSRSHLNDLTKGAVAQMKPTE